MQSMDDTPQDAPQPEETPTQSTPPDQPTQSIVEAIGKHRKAKLDNAPRDASFKIILLAVVFGIFILGGVLFVLTRNIDNPNAQPTPTPTPTPAPNEPTPTPTPAPRGQRYVAFIKNDPQSNVYVVDVVGRNTQKLTDNTDDRVTYSLITWRSYDQMAYVQCGVAGGGCQVIARSITSGEETVIITNRQFSGGSIIRALRYDHEGDALAVYYESPDGRAFAVLFAEERQVTLKEFGQKTQREQTFMDQVSLTFSPDDRHIIVVTTLLSPNADSRFPTLYTFHTETGALLFGLGTNASIATGPHWIDNTTFYFEQSDQFMVKNIVTQGETVKIAANTKDIDVQTAYNKDYLIDDTIVYWTQLENGRSTLGTFPLNGRRPQFRDVSPNFYLPQWYSTTLVAALETREAVNNNAPSFVSTGKLMMVNVTASSSYELEPSGVVEFAIEPPKE